jgi:uncharacterized hydrophobic protein (TIGR00271 family)
MPTVKSLSHQEIMRETIHENTQLSGAYIAMNIFAATIASYGLLANSASGVIGAMIVAMLLGPITGTALALVDSDMKLLRTGLVTLLVGAIVVMAAAFVIGFFEKEIPITNEIMARTSPNLFDLMIALVGGAAGAYATVSPKLSVGMVGVAIATALVPPLSSASILFARGDFDLGAGALLLAFTNMVAIQFSSSVVMWLTGFRKMTDAHNLTVSGFLKHNSVSIFTLIILGILLTRNLHETVSQKKFEIETRGIIEQNINSVPSDYLAEMRFIKINGDSTIIRAVVRSPNIYTAEQVRSLQEKLPQPPDHSTLELQIRNVEAITVTSKGILYQEREK